MDPLVARLFVDLGFDTKEKLAQWCAENAVMPARDYWDDQWIQTLTLPLAVAGVERGEISIVVAGGETQGAFRLIGGRHPKNGTISVDAWR